jgi:D-glycero-alpha-D-manno-heptose-7-phosphate kinase
MYGGLQSLRWGPGTHQRQGLNSLIIPELQKRILLFYSGQSRNSGINNWALFKGFIDRQDGIRSQFQAISNAAESLERALEKQDWVAAGAAISDEWKTRKTLAPGITTPSIDRAFQEANQIAPISGKVCGAGGGGCFFVRCGLVS